MSHDKLPARRAVVDVVPTAAEGETRTVGGSARGIDAAEGMDEVMRLTRTGRLTEATALIQRNLGSGTATGLSAQPATQRARSAPWPGRPMPQPPGPPRSWSTASGASSIKGGGVRETRASAGVHRSYSGPAGSRDYTVFVPDAPAAGPRPLVVMLHGCTQNADDFATGTRMNALAQAGGFVVAYPEQSAQANAQRCWNWFQARDQGRDHGEPAIIAGITRAVVAEHGIDERRVFVAGMSAGAAMAVIMGATHPDLYAAVGVHSGLAYGSATDLASALQAMKQGASDGGAAQGAGELTPTIVFHGDRDYTVHHRNGEQVLGGWTRQHAGRPRFDVSVAEYEVPGRRTTTRSIYRDRTGALVAEGWSVHGLGHAWSGGDAAGSYTDAKGPDASAEMVRFFTDVVSDRR